MSTTAESVSDENKQFVDPTRHTLWVQRVLIAHVALAVVAALIGVLEYGVLLDYENMHFTDIEVAKAAGRVSDQRQTIVAGLQIAVLVAVAWALLRWIRLANDNLHRLGATGLKFTPSKAMLSFVVPVLNLWAPYFAVREVAQCSSSPLAWRAEPVTPLVPWWWGLLLSYVAVSVIALGFSFFGNNIDSLQTGSALSLLSDFLAVLSGLALYFLVAHISQLQKHQSDFVLID